jgi:hypothetical protein
MRLLTIVTFALVLSLTMARPGLEEKESELTRREVIKELLDLMTRAALVKRDPQEPPPPPPPLEWEIPPHSSSPRRVLILVM